MFLNCTSVFSLFRKKKILLISYRNRVPNRNGVYAASHDRVVQNIVREKKYTVACLVFLVNNSLEFPLLTDMCKLDFGGSKEIYCPSKNTMLGEAHGGGGGGGDDVACGFIRKPVEVKTKVLETGLI